MGLYEKKQTGFLIPVSIYVMSCEINLILSEANEFNLLIKDFYDPLHEGLNFRKRSRPMIYGINIGTYRMGNTSPIL